MQVLTNKNMGRNDKKYSLSLKRQAYNKLESMACFNESKKLAKADGTMKYKIFSISTLKTYKKKANKFCEYVESEHPKCTTISSAEKYVNEWLEYRASLDLSAWTVQLDAKAIGKLFCIGPKDENYFKPPVRRRADIKRSRHETKRSKLFSEKKHAMLVKYVKSTGERREETEKAKSEYLMTKTEIENEIEYLSSQKPSIEIINRLTILKDTRFFNEEYYMYTKGKGGRKRISPICGKYAEEVVEFIKSRKDQKKIFDTISEYAPMHKYRSDYCNTIYKNYARKIEDIPKDKLRGGINQMYSSEVYFCRKDRKNDRFDKHALEICSKALGHNRLDVVVNNYLRGLENE